MNRMADGFGPRQDKIRWRPAQAFRCKPVRARGVAVALACAWISTGAVVAAESWTDISSKLVARLTNSGAKPGWPGGCSGVVVNRTNGDVTIKVVGLGLWRSSDQGANWRRIDDDVVSGRDETGWATSVDQNAPGRLVSFSLDGHAGWTSDGVHWKRFGALGRNWDYGSVDWSAAIPQTIIAARHETTPPGEVYLSTNGGVNWRLLSIRVHDQRGRTSMLGALDAETLVYGNGEGILRSRDAAATWTRVSDLNPQTRIPVTFHGVHYLGGTNGLIVSRDRGATWKVQGSPVDLWLGPYFGRDAQEMMGVGKNGAFVTRDAGATWKKVADVKSKEAGFLFTPNWFGCYAWDPVNNVIYASAMGNPVLRLKL
jgi:hypothetical protein